MILALKEQLSHKFNFTDIVLSPTNLDPSPFLPELFDETYFNAQNFEPKDKIIIDMKDEKYLESIRRILDESNCAVTIEATKDTLDTIKPDLFNRCHIIYRISDPYLEMLKDTDTLSIDAGWYRVHQVTKCNMMEIQPDNYKFDEEI